jgi:hypothetical protein
LANASSVASAQSASLPENQETKVDPFIQRHHERRAKNPEGLLFTVRLKDNRKQIQLGEIVTLELSFAASKPGTLTLDAATYDRSGRLHSDGFALDPSDGVVDPIADYFDAGLSLFMEGGLRSIPDLTNNPYLITEEVNEWQRIDKPGHYRMYVVSSRVGRKGGGGIYVANGGSVAVSNVIEFDILPQNKKWATQKLKEAISVLAKADADHEPACRTLRFLGTTAAAIEMRKRFRGDDNRCEWDYKFGLIGSPQRDFVIRDMESSISLPEQSVTSHFIRTLALLEFTKLAPEEPQYPGNENQEQISQWRTQMDQRRSVYDDLCLQHVRQLVMALPHKEGQARATSLQTLVDYRRELSASGFSQLPDLLASLPEVFNRLPLHDQLTLLMYQWKPIATTAMLPALREVFNYSYKPSKHPELEPFDEIQQEDLRSSALRRIYELAPEEGRRLIVEEIGRLEPRVEVEVLRVLPDETLPSLNSVLLTNLQQALRKGDWSTVTISELIERYASDEIASRVRAVYEARDVEGWHCPAQAALVAYFLRVAPSFGAEQLNKVLGVRGRGYAGCYTKILGSVAELQMSPEVEDIAIAALDNADAEVVSQAAGVLGQYGSADAEKALWRRLEKWHEAAQSQGEEELSSGQGKIQEALHQALTNGNAWLSDPEKLRRLRDLCLTDKTRQELDQLINNWEYKISVDFDSFDDEASEFRVAHYQLKSLASLREKLLQFPKGTVFTFKVVRNRGDSSKPEELFQMLKSYLEENGMKLERETKE